MFRLSLYPNKLQNLPTSLEKLTNLQELDVSNCSLESCPEAISKVSHLQMLSLEGNNVRSLTDSLSNLKDLTVLNVSRCGLTSYPDVISELTNLNELFLRGNAMNDVSDSIANLKELPSLDISQCNLTTFPVVVTNLDELRSLMLSGNSVRLIPDSAAELKRLEVLDATACGLWQNIEALSKLSSLRHVDLSKNWLPLPSSLEQLNCLQTLRLSACGMNQLPDFICQFFKLKRLDLGTNRRLTSLPRSLTTLSALHFLNLKGCGFTILPDVLLHMSHFLVVDLSDNPILRLGEEVVKRWCTYPNIMKDKRFLNIRCDLQNLEEPPFAIIEQGPEACYEYYCSMKLTSKQNCRFVNVQVLGETGSGKTSLIQTMKNERPSLVGSSESVSDSVGTVKLMADDVLMQIYDYAPDAIYDLAYHMFIKSTTQVVVLAVNLPEYTKEKHDTAVTRWLSSIFTTSVDCSVIVAGTRADLCTDDEIKRKKTLIESEIKAWVEAERKFILRLPDTKRNLVVNSKRVARTKFIVTSSAKINGVEQLVKCLFERAKEKKVVLPKHWRNMYRSFYKISDEGQVVPVPVPMLKARLHNFSH